MSSKELKRLDTKNEPPNVESLRWLIMVFDTVARMGVPLRGKRLCGARLGLMRRDKEGDLVPSSSWELTGKVYLEAMLEDGEWRFWGIPVEAVNNRDTRWVLKAVLEDLKVVDFIMADNLTIRNMRAVS
jgi:hypothetical protein